MAANRKPRRPQAAPAKNHTTVAQLQAEVERLKKTVKRLRAERKRDREELAWAHEHRHNLQRALLDYAGIKADPNDWKDFREEDYTVTADEILADLDRLEKESGA